jgi:predicted flap endonuclease-1-like 5' DNA nuclease
MSDEEKIETKTQTANRVAAATSFATKIDSGTLITSIQKDLMRVHDFAMSQERSTTFVLSDFTLQLKAVVTQEVTKAGEEKTMFALPTKQGEIDPNLMSTLNLTLRPIPLAVKTVTSTRPVESVEGIGPVLGGKLRDLGIATVSDLALASTQDLSKAKISSKKATEFISMAKLMVKSNIAGVEGVDEQVAELLVVGARIDSKEKLAEATPEELITMLNDAVKSGKVKVPKSFKLTVDDSARWVESAKTLVDKSRALPQ